MKKAVYWEQQAVSIALVKQTPAMNPVAWGQVMWHTLFGTCLVISRCLGESYSEHSQKWSKGVSQLLSSVRGA